VAYILTSSDAGYDPTLIKGIIAAESDEANSTWYDATASIDSKTTNGYTDWYLPSLSELRNLYINRVAIGGFFLDVNGRYWSSTEYGLDVNSVYQIIFSDGQEPVEYKNLPYYPSRAIRQFSIPKKNALNVSGSVVVSGSLFLNEGAILSTASLTILSQDYSIFGTTDVNNYPSGTFSGSAAIFITTRTNYPISNRFGAQTQIKSGPLGTDVTAWYYDADGTSYFPGDVNIGFDAPLSEYLTSGSLNIRNGNINLSGSLTISGSIVGANNLVTTSSFNSYTASVVSVNTSSLVTTSSFNTFSSSVNTTTASLNSFTASVIATGSNINSFTASVNGKTGSYATTGSNIFIGNQTITGSLSVSGSIVVTGSIVGVDNLVTTSSFNSFSSSVNSFTASVIATGSIINTFTSSVNTTTASLNTTTASLNSKTGSYATTGSNIFTGSQNISGSLIVTGSARGNVVPIPIVSSTASLDMTLGSYFTLTLANTTNTHIRATSITPGVNATLLITTGTNSSASLSPLLLQPSGSSYTASLGSGKKDVLSLVAFDSTNMYVVSTKAMQ
jgi:hypothetical protein